MQAKSFKLTKRDKKKIIKNNFFVYLIKKEIIIRKKAFNVAF